MRTPLAMALAAVLLSACDQAREEAPARPVPCSAEWYSLVEREVGVSDAQGHGPDLGSPEWRSAVEFKLGIREDPGVPEPDGESWCRYIDELVRRRASAPPSPRGGLRS